MQAAGLVEHLLRGAQPVGQRQQHLQGQPDVVGGDVVPGLRADRVDAGLAADAAGARRVEVPVQRRCPATAHARAPGRRRRRCRCCGRRRRPSRSSAAPATSSGPAITPSVARKPCTRSKSSPGRAHRDRQRRAGQPDLQRLLGGDGVRSRGVLRPADAQHRCPAGDSSHADDGTHAARLRCRRGPAAAVHRRRAGRRKAARLGGQAKPQLEVGGRTHARRRARRGRRRRRAGSSSARPSRCRPTCVLVREQPPGGGPVAALRAGLAGGRRPTSSPLLAGDLPFLTAALIAELRARLTGRRRPGRRRQRPRPVPARASGGRPPCAAVAAAASGPTSLRRVLAPLAVAPLRPVVGRARRRRGWTATPPPTWPAPGPRSLRPPSPPVPRPAAGAPAAPCSRAPEPPDWPLIERRPSGVGPAHAHRHRRSPRAGRPPPRPSAVRPRRHRRRHRPQSRPRRRPRRRRRASRSCWTWSPPRSTTSPRWSPAPTRSSSPRAPARAAAPPARTPSTARAAVLLGRRRRAGRGPPLPARLVAWASTQSPTARTPDGHGRGVRRLPAGQAAPPRRTCWPARAWTPRSCGPVGSPTTRRPAGSPWPRRRPRQRAARRRRRRPGRPAGRRRRGGAVLELVSGDVADRRGCQRAGLTGALW